MESPTQFSARRQLHGVKLMHDQTEFRLRLAQDQRDSLLAALQMLISYKGLPCGPDNRDLWAEARKTAAEVTKNL